MSMRCTWQANKNVELSRKSSRERARESEKIIKYGISSARHTTSKYFVRTSKLLTSKMPHNFCRKSSVNVHGALSDWNFASIFIERNGWITFFACSFQMCVPRRCAQCDSMHMISSIWYFRSSVVVVSVAVVAPLAIAYSRSAYR